MEITLNGKVYYVARDQTGERRVLVRVNGRTWRMAGPDIARDVLGGFLLAPLRMMVNKSGNVSETVRNSL